MAANSTAALQRLAQHVQSDRVTFDRIGTRLTERLSLSLLDLIGCYLASARMGTNASIVELSECHGARDPSALIWGHPDGATPEFAALANGTIAHHAEFDGGWHGPPRVGVHPAITVLPAAMAVAESCGASGLEFVAAVAAGYDVLAAMARGLSPSIVECKLHPPGLLGSFGSAAAAARLLRRNVDETTAALKICGGVSPLCPFESFTAGASAKDLYGGWPASIGILAASTDSSTAHEFTLPELLGREPIALTEIEPGLAIPALTGADFKAYPACRTVHPALTALESLLSDHPVEFDEVEAIHVETYSYAVELDAASDARWPIGARTSVLMCLALRLRFGPLQPHLFTEENLRSAELNGLCARSRTSIGRYADRSVRGATVSLVLRGGARWSFSVDAEKWSHAAPADATQIIEKFHRQSCASLDLPDRNELVDRVMDVHRASSMHFVSEILARSKREPGLSEKGSPPGPSCAGVVADLHKERSDLLRKLGHRRMDAELLGQAFATVDRMGSDLSTRGAERALALSLALAPASAGPVPLEWPRQFGERVVALASAGFSGPPGVVAGARGLRHFAAASGLPQRQATV